METQNDNQENKGTEEKKHKREKTRIEEKTGRRFKS
jgi:hypothetical protein